MGLKEYIKKTPLWIRISYSMTYQRIRFPGAYKQQTEELSHYEALLKNRGHQLIFDVGANVGNKSSIFSKLATKVVAFEPSKPCYHILESRFKNSNVSVFNVALGSQKGFLDFFEIKENEAYNTLSKKHIETTVSERNIVDIKSILSQKVAVDTIENFIEKFGKPDYLKIDVEGFEIEVLKGLKTTIPFVTFEANLPEFREEAIEGIHYLSRISNGKYQFNFVIDTSFILEDYISAEQAVLFLKNTELRYLEIYAKI